MNQEHTRFTRRAPKDNPFFQHYTNLAFPHTSKHIQTILLLDYLEELFNTRNYKYFDEDRLFSALARLFVEKQIDEELAEQYFEWAFRRTKLRWHSEGEFYRFTTHLRPLLGAAAA